MNDAGSTHRHGVGDPAALTGSVDLVGRLLDASNAVFLGRCGSIPVAYKPVRGERPLWDFPDGCLAYRERAAYVLDAAAGFGIVPPTVLLDGPVGLGAVQWWVTEPPGSDDDDDDVDDDDDGDHAADHDDAPERDPDQTPTGPDPIEPEDLNEELDEPLFTLMPPGEVRPPWLPVFTGELHDGRPVTLAHADTPELRSVAVFDAILNNSDRKGSHLLRGVDGRLWGIDHGVSLHEDDKLRTVLWGWAGERIPDHDLARVETLERALTTPTLQRALSELLTAAEIDALAGRVARLLRTGRHPVPQRGWPSVPWPAL